LTEHGKIEGTMVKAGADIAGNLALVRQRIAAAARTAGRDAGSVTLVAVSKTHPAEAVAAALEAGQRVFGENRVQEAQRKFPAIRRAWPELTLHLIGPLQTNKVREAVALFDVIETVDRPRLAEALAAEMQRSGRKVACFVQVNTGREPQKAGIAPELAGDFIADCRERLQLPIQGLMCIPPVDVDPAPHFTLLGELARCHGVALLSMGMSGDFATAVALGATHVRIGTAIFGERRKVSSA
jgi:pyridoxal phosphate enzyme (YggS family)